MKNNDRPPIPTSSHTTSCKHLLGNLHEQPGRINKLKLTHPLPSVHEYGLAIAQFEYHIRAGEHEGDGVGENDG
jgi:hypothetical protein